ncbi:MAG: MBL fold metallo-hydrolase [Desulfomonilaceae bacterium]|nr:MBL fold metallo-hydrolase [Desulfomonilaceae bacterium]
MQLTPLASGSSGNSFLVRSNGSAILVDAGLSCKQICTRLEQAGADPGSLKGIVVSHEHSDHVKGVGVLSRKFKLPVYANLKTWNAVEQTLGEVHRVEIFETGKIFEIGGFRIHPFSVPHDCADPVGFRISCGTAKIGIATDLGTATGLVTSLLTGLQLVVLESNHDPKMLRDGPYPWELKQRVRSRLGHLSNPESAQLLQRVVSDELQAVILAHMSETNNRADLALDCARSCLGEFLEHRGKIFCAYQNAVGPTIDI